MATVPSPSPMRGEHQRQLRHDRIVATLVVLLFVALMALMIWLASLGGGVDVNNDVWMMP